MPARKKNSENSDTLIPPRNVVKRARPRKPAAVSPPPERVRVFSAEEKHQLILAHAAQRQPIDRVQRFSLWIGVFICFFVIGIGWLYTIRQSIAGAIDDSWKEGVVAETTNFFDRADESKDTFLPDLDSMLQQIQTQEAAYFEDLQMQAALMQKMSASIEADSGTSPTSTSEDHDMRGDLFQPTEANSVSSGPSFDLPPGVSQD